MRIVRTLGRGVANGLAAVLVWVAVAALFAGVPAAPRHVVAVGAAVAVLVVFVTAVAGVLS
jgi:hypothetical protein